MQLNDRIHRSGADEEAGGLPSAQAVVATWEALAAALIPIIGERGAAALFKRSAYLARAAHPWMAGAHDSIDARLDFLALESLLVQQTPAEIAAGGAALVRKLGELLSGLIGGSLADRLLRATEVDSVGHQIAQDASP